MLLAKSCPIMDTVFCCEINIRDYVILFWKYCWSYHQWQYFRMKGYFRKFSKNMQDHAHVPNECGRGVLEARNTERQLTVKYDENPSKAEGEDKDERKQWNSVITPLNNLWPSQYWRNDTPLSQRTQIIQCARDTQRI